MEISREELLLCCEGGAQWGSGFPLLSRTLELYRNQVLYCFEEPQNSTQKVLKEKVYVQGCRVVDCGTIGHMECLALFLWDYDYLEEVDPLGNKKRLVFRPRLAASNAVPSINCLHLFGVGEANEGELLDPEIEVLFNRGYFLTLLYLPSKAAKWSWLKAVRELSESYAGWSGTPDPGHQPSPPQSDQQAAPRGVRRAAADAARRRLRRSPLYDTLLRRENQECADCSAPDPTWCVLQPFGVFTCIDCIGVHRQLWANKCRGVELDHWPEADLAFMTEHGNAAANAVLEFGLRGVGRHDGGGKPSPSSTISDREVFIYEKYVERMFCKENIEQTPGMLAEEIESEGQRLPVNGPALASSSSTSSPAGAIAFPFPLTPYWEHSGPPRYSGLAILVVQQLLRQGRPSLSLFRQSGWVCVLTNGYQELRTKAGKGSKDGRALARWNEAMQLGVEHVNQPLCVSVFSDERKSRLLGVGEFYLHSGMIRDESEASGGDEEEEEDSSQEMVPITVPIYWSHLNHRCQYRPPDMILTYTTLPFIVIIFSLLTFLILKKIDPINLEDYKDKVYGIPPVAVCLTCIYPILVLVMYDFVLKCGVKPAKVGIR